MRNVLLVEPWFSGSHRAWAEGYRRHSRHQIALLTLEPRGWRATLQTSAPALAAMVKEAPELVIASSMLDLADFKRISQLTETPTLLFMHENQLTYDRARPDEVFGLINWQGVEAADVIAFNSRFHLEDFFGAAPGLDLEPGSIEAARGRSLVLPVGLELDGLENEPGTETEDLVVLWNHRWERDKAPEEFVAAMTAVANLPLKLLLLGEQEPGDPHVAQLQDMFGQRVLQAGFASPTDYRRLLKTADVVVSTARQEFFGVAVGEAMAAGAVPLVPDRLAYPELVPREVHDVCLYQEGELPERLTYFSYLAADRRQLRALQALVSEATNRFRWQALAGRYDQLVDSMVENAT